MFLESTWILFINFRFVCVRVYRAVYSLCFLNICRIGSILVHGCKIWGHTLPWDRQIGVKSASSPPRAKSAPRGSKSTTFAKGIFQLFNLQKIGMNPIGDPSVLPTQFPIYLWLQAEVWEAFAIAGWCVVSSIPYFVPLCLNVNFRFRNLRFNQRGM